MRNCRGCDDDEEFIPTPQQLYENKKVQHLLIEGREFLKLADIICSTCHKKGKCNDCGCGAKFTIQNMTLTKSSCLLEKW